MSRTDDEDHMNTKVLIAAAAAPIALTLLYLGYRCGQYLKRRANKPIVRITNDGGVHILVRNRTDNIVQVTSTTQASISVVSSAQIRMDSSASNHVSPVSYNDDLPSYVEATSPGHPSSRRASSCGDAQSRLDTQITLDQPPGTASSFIFPPRNSVVSRSVSVGQASISTSTIPQAASDQDSLALPPPSYEEAISLQASPVSSRPPSPTQRHRSQAIDVS